MRRGSGLLKRCTAALALILGLCAAGPAQEDDGIPTLRVFTNVLQVPTLVLNDQRKPLPPIPENRFFVSIDGGPPFRVSHARLEGNDPIALSILVDVDHLPGSGRTKVEDAIAGLLPTSVHTNDMVSVYRLNCRLTRGIVEQPTNLENLQTVTTVLFGSADAAAGKSHANGGCVRGWNLLDSIGAAIEGFEPATGRRVLLVLTDGEDRGSKATWLEVRAAAQMKGVAVFALQPKQQVAVPSVRRNRVMEAEIAAEVTNMPSLCESTGGLVLELKPERLAEELREFLALVRGRYIIEFPRPAAAPGSHNMTITAGKLAAFIRPAGISMELPDPDLAKDPNTFLPDPTKAPEVGTQRPKQ